MKHDAPPTGIIRCLPAIYADPKSDALKNYLAAKQRMAVDPNEYWFLALAKKPKQDFLHIYIAIGGRIDCRFTFAGFRQGGLSRLWDGLERNVDVFAICAGPAEAPPQPIKRRGFQGFRYTQNLW